VCKIWSKNSQLFGKNVRKTQRGFFLTHTVVAEHCRRLSIHLQPSIIQGYIPHLLSS